MCEYIKREYAIDAVLDVYYDTPDIDLSGEKFEAAIRKIQAADVAPVRHGKWKRSGALLECQRCGEIYSQLGGNAGKSWNYCPNCGAIMNLEEEQHELRRDL